MHKICFFVPETNIEEVKDALFAAGAGCYKNYDHCCWQTLGQGQFRPLQGSTPHIGQQGNTEIVPEYKVEMLCPDGLVTDVIEALRSAHPYEEPAFECWPIRIS